MTSTIQERFESDIAQHEMTVLHNDGLYRHLRFKRPDQSAYWFDVVTWPGSLTINGDMGTFTFSRLEDMFEFFRSGTGVNPGYWGEKVLAGETKRYDEDYARRVAAEYLDEWAEHTDPDAVGRVRQMFRELIADEDRADEDNFRLGLAHIGEPFVDFWWEADLHPHTVHFLWCCWAIRHAVTAFNVPQLANATASKTTVRGGA
jgi:hypothetical protein